MTLRVEISMASFVFEAVDLYSLFKLNLLMLETGYGVGDGKPFE